MERIIQAMFVTFFFTDTALAKSSVRVFPSHLLSYRTTAQSKKAYGQKKTLLVFLHNILPRKLYNISTEKSWSRNGPFLGEHVNSPGMGTKNRDFKKANTF